VELCRIRHYKTDKSIKHIQLINKTLTQKQFKMNNFTSYQRLLIGILVLLILGGTGCNQSKNRAKKSKEKSGKAHVEPLELTLQQATRLAQLPMSCLQKEYPNKPGQVLGDPEDLGEPRDLHPAFFGCFDWHSSVHGHWSLVKLLKKFPEIDQAEQIKQMLTENITKNHIQAEVRYFKKKHSDAFERTYGWAWLLKLAEELNTWDSPLADKLAKNLAPLTNLIVQRYQNYLPKLNYPIRVGEHSNTAFGLSFAWDYAHTTGHKELKNSIESRAKAFYLHDKNCPFGWEPSGHDFLSPCLEEIDLMRRVLTAEKFHSWMAQFAPQLSSESFNMAVGKVSDRKDGKLVHLDGLNFSRAWVFYGLAKQYPRYNHLIQLANIHMNHSLPNLVEDSYEGGHWLGSFALYALTNNQ